MQGGCHVNSQLTQQTAPKIIEDVLKTAYIRLRIVPTYTIVSKSNRSAYALRKIYFIDKLYFFYFKYFSIFLITILSKFFFHCFQNTLLLSQYKHTLNLTLYTLLKSIGCDGLLFRLPNTQ